MIAQEFNITAFTRQPKAATLYADRYALPEGRIRLAFALALEIERDRLRKSHGIKPLTVRVLDETGTMRMHIINGGAENDEGLPPGAIMSHRPEAERANQERAAAAQAVPDTGPKENMPPVPWEKSGENAVIDMAEFVAWRNARDAFVRAARNKSAVVKPPAFDPNIFMKQQEQSVEALLLEKMEQRLRLVGMLSDHAPELFGDDRMAREYAICSVLLERPARTAAEAVEIARLDRARAIVFTDYTDHDRSQWRDIVTMIEDYDRFVNELSQPSGIALLNDPMKCEVLRTCLTYMKPDAQGFAASLKDAATHTYKMVSAFTYFSPAVKEQYALAI